MEKIIAELLKFSTEILYLGKPIIDIRVEDFEKKYNLELPNDFKFFIKKFNGLTMNGTEIFCFDSKNRNSFEGIYHFEHFEVVQPQFNYLVPFSPDGGGNFYCFDTNKRNKKGKCPVVFWQSLYKYSETDLPEIDSSDFGKWLKKVIIDWTLEDYNYDGSEK